MQLCVGEQKRIERHLKAAKLNVMAVTAIHRLVHHATIISITQQSYRKNKPHQQG
jgi:DNA replication protein DnaC